MIFFNSKIIFSLLLSYWVLNSIATWGSSGESSQIEPCRLFLENSKQPLALLTDQQINIFYKGIIDRLLQTLQSKPNPQKAKEAYYFVEQQASSLNLGIRSKALIRNQKQKDLLTSIISILYTLSIKQDPLKPLVHSWLSGQIKKAFGETSLLNMTESIKNQLEKSLLLYISIINNHFNHKHRELQSLGLKQVLLNMGAKENELNSPVFLSEISKINLEKYLTYLEKELPNIKTDGAQGNHND